MSSARSDYYQTLECARDANRAALKSAYRKLAMTALPGSQSGRCGQRSQIQSDQRGCHRRKDPQERAAYDRYGHEAFTQGMNGGGGGGPFGGGFGGGRGDFGDIGDIFETIFGSAFGGGGQGRSASRTGAVRICVMIWK